MDIKENSQMVVTDADGKEHVLQILFTYEHEERNKSYVFFYEVGQDENNVLVMSYTDEGELNEIEDDEEYDEVEEVFNAWQDDPEIQKLKEE